MTPHGSRKESAPMSDPNHPLRITILGAGFAALSTVRELRRRVDGLAKRLGENAERRAFWRARLAEALTGLAADLLRDHDLVQLLPRARRRPDPAGRLQRLRGLLAHFPIRPSTSTRVEPEPRPRRLTPETPVCPGGAAEEPSWKF